jgi:hypothetical protein
MSNCYLCGGVASTTDHIPPRGFFKALPVNKITLPACESCNQSASLDEEYMRATLAAQGYGARYVARDVWEGAVKRSFEHRPKGLRARLAQALVAVEIRTFAREIAGHLPGIKVDGARAGRVLRKIAKGIYYHEKGVRLDDNELLLFRDGDVRLDFEAITRGWPQVDMGEGFRYRSQHSAEGSMIWFEFYRTNWWLALTGDFARNYGKKKTGT